MTRVLRNSFQQVLELDFTIFRTFVSLSSQPGRMAREYVEGRRTVYLNPLKYAFLTTTLFVFLVTFLEGRTELLSEHPVHPLSLLSLYVFYLGLAGDAFAVLGFGMAALPYLEWFVYLLPYAIFVFLVPLAALQKHLFRQQDVNVSECYVFQIYVLGHLMLLHLLLIVPGLYLSSIGYLAAHLVEFGYLAWAVNGFHRTGMLRSSAGALALMVSYRVLFAATFLFVLWFAA